MTRVMRSLSDITELPLPNAIVFFLISTFDERRTYAIYWVGVELIFIRVLILHQRVQFIMIYLLRLATYLLCFVLKIFNVLVWVPTAWVLYYPR